MKKRLMRLLCCTVAILLSIPFGAAAQEHFITDVSPVSFCAVWHVGAPASGSIEVFFDEDGVQPASGISVDSQPQIDPNSDAGASAMSAGIVKVRARGLEPDTTYYYRLSTQYTESGETAHFPEASPFPSVRTAAAAGRPQSANQPFTNDLVALGAYLKGTLTPVHGALFIASIDGAAYPVSSFSGDGIESPWSIVDLSNLYSAADGRPLPLSGGELLTVYEITPTGVFRDQAYRVFDPETVADITEDLPIFGDFAGAYGIGLDDALSGLALFAGIADGIKPVSGITPTPRRAMGEVIYVLQQITGIDGP